jgi:hypothetical protein
MPLTKVSFSVIQVANNVTSTTVGNTTSIPSFTFDQNGVITSASNTAISGAGITANTIANSAFQTGSIENYSRAAGLLGMRNRIINGAMVISQRSGTSSVSPTDGQFSVDRWKCRTDITGKYTFQQNAGSVTPPVGFSNYLGITSSTAYTVPSGGYYFLVQPIEGFNTADLGWGTANAKTVTLSFQVYSSLTGTFGGSLMNAANNRSYPFTYTISTANTWTTASVTIAGDTTGTWVGATNGSGIEVNFGLGMGSTLSGTAGAWAGASYYSATGAVSVVGTNGATFYITGVQLEVGSSATGYEYRQYGTEFALCQRYYYVLVSGAGSYFLNAFYYNTNHLIAAVNYPVAMRSTPSLVSATGTNYYQFYRNATADGLNSLTLTSNGLTSGSLQNTTDVSGTAGNAGALYADNANVLVAFNAEL